MDFITLGELSPFLLHFEHGVGQWTTDKDQVLVEYNHEKWSLTKQEYEMAMDNEFVFYWHNESKGWTMEMRDFILHFLHKFGSHAALFVKK